MTFAILLTLVALVIVATILTVHLARAKAAVSEKISAVFAIKKDGETWVINEKTGMFLTMVTDIFAEKLKASVKGTLMNGASQVARIETAMKRDIGKEKLSEANPLAGAVVGQLPAKWQNAVFSNPYAAQAALNLFNQFTGGAQPTNGKQDHDFAAGLGKY